MRAPAASNPFEIPLAQRTTALAAACPRKQCALLLIWFFQVSVGEIFLLPSTVFALATPRAGIPLCCLVVQRQAHWVVAPRDSGETRTTVAASAPG